MTIATSQAIPDDTTSALAFPHYRRAIRPLKVLLAGRLTALAEPSAAEHQLPALARALSALGMEARPWRPWEDSLAGVDCLHLFGTASEHGAVIEAARKHEVKVVLSPLAGFDPAEQAPPLPLARRVTAWAGVVGRSVCPRFTSWRRQVYQVVDLLMPSSNSEAQQLIASYQVPAERVHIVHHGADPRFAQADPGPFVRLFGVRDFVLHAGAIEPGNNQLAFLWAMQDVDVPVVVLGNATPGYEWYLAECRRVAGARVRFLPAIPHDDPLLAGAYAASACLMVPGGSETAVLTALEAGMSGTSLVLAEGGCAGEYFGRQALYVRGDDVHGMRRAVLTAVARGRSKSLAGHVRTWFSWNSAAKAVREGYRKVLT
jgi:glycosyltransferase involved in cell wall biosynthesis